MRDPITIDCHYLGPRFAASYLLIEGDEAAFIDDNTAHAVPTLLAALQSRKLAPETVRWVIVTHVHLDHAGGTSALMKACPNAMLLAHPRAAPHLIDPAKLVTSARKVYGDAEFARLYGTIEAVPESRVRIMQDGETLTWGDRTLTFLHTRGHANHHFCIHDSASGAVFTGDSFGLRYPALQGGGLFVFPSTSPTDFDPVEALRSVDRIAALAKVVYPTHFGEVPEVAAAAQQLREHLDFSASLLDRAVSSTLAGDELNAFCHTELKAHYAPELQRRGLDTPDHWKLLELDLDLNAQGIAFVAAKRRTMLRG